MKAKFVSETVSQFLKPKSKADIIHDLAKLTKKELGDKLVSASLKGHKDVVQWLLDAGADVNAKDTWGRTALMKASLNGHKDIVQLLIEAGADVNVKDNDGRTALMCASLYGHKDIATLLRKHGAKE